VVRATFRLMLFGYGAIVAASAWGPLTYAQPPQGSNGGPPNGPPMYQRQAFDGSRHDRDRDRGRRRDNFRQSFPFTTPQVNSGWYQRPYPTHLDYFRLRSNEAPPRYYGNWYGSYGGWSGRVGVWDNDGSGYATQPDDGGVGNPGVSPRALLMNPPSEQNKSSDANGKASPPDGGSESLPAPSK
jgi:hypothetical protein